MRRHNHVAHYPAGGHAAEHADISPSPPNNSAQMASAPRALARKQPMLATLYKAKRARLSLAGWYLCAMPMAPLFH